MNSRTEARFNLFTLPIICGGIIVGLAMGMRGSLGLFLTPMTAAHDWSREGFAFALALQNLLWGLAQPLFGALSDRFGAARVVAGGVALYALGLLWMAVTATTAGFTLSAGVCLGLALSGCAFGTVYGAVARTVPATRRGAALGLTGAIGGLGQFLMIPVVGTLLVRHGWVDALIFGAVSFLVATVLAPGLRAGAASAAHAAAADDAPGMRAVLRDAFGQRAFWLLTLGFFTCGFQLAFVSIHLPAYLTDRGFGARDGTTALALIMLANAFGIYACGKLGDLYRPRSVLTLLYLVRSAIFLGFLLLPLSRPSLYVFSVLIGLTWLGTVPLTNGVILRLHGARYLSTLFGFVFVGHQLGSFLGAWVGGYVYDVTGSYTPVWWACVALGLSAAALHFPIDDTRPVLVRQVAAT